MIKCVLDIYIHLSQEWILWVLNSYYELTDTLQGQKSRRKNSMAHPNVCFRWWNFKFGKSSNARWWRLPVRGAVVVALPVWSEIFGQWDVFAFCRLLQLKLFKPPSVEIVTSAQDFFLVLGKSISFLSNWKRSFHHLPYCPGRHRVIQSNLAPLLSAGTPKQWIRSTKCQLLSARNLHIFPTPMASTISTNSKKNAGISGASGTNKSEEVGTYPSGLIGSCCSGWTLRY